jgi:hypothetical protein
MNDRSKIALTLIVCGTLCVLAVLGITTFISYELMPRVGDLAVSFRSVGDWVVALLVLGGLVGVVMVGTGVLIGTRN